MNNSFADVGPRCMECPDWTKCIENKGCILKKFTVGQITQLQSHSNTPWTIQENVSVISIKSPEDSRTRQDSLVATVPVNGRNGYNAKANADLICRAVNAHETLVKACEVALCEIMQGGTADHLVVKERLREAIAMANAV
jgi:hypothetical protein